MDRPRPAVRRISMAAQDNWIRLRSPIRPVDGLNMDQVAAFIRTADHPRSPILLYLGWTPEGKNPWITLTDEDAEAVVRWLMARDLADNGQTSERAPRFSPGVDVPVETR
jgi:hypothetical protein